MSDQQTVDFVIDDVNLEGVRGWNGESGPTVPPGDYEVEVTNAVVEPTKKGDGRNIKLTLAVRNEGEYYDTDLLQWLKIPGPNDKKGVAMRMAHVIRDVLGVPMLPNGGFQGAHLIGRRMIIQVAVEEDVEVGFDTVTNQETRKVITRTKIQNERPVVGAAAPQPPPVAPPPANAQPATQTRRPAAAPPTPARGR